MKDWNAVVTVYDKDGYRLAKRLMSRFGRIDSTDYFNVLVMKVPDVDDFTREIFELFEQTPGFLNEISRVVPAHATIEFQSPQEFNEKASAVLRDWSERLAGKSFYIRLHRRGFKGRIASPDAERTLDDSVLERLRELDCPGRIDFEDPDFVIDIEMVGNRAGFSIWSRQELNRFDFLHVD